MFFRKTENNTASLVAFIVEYNLTPLLSVICLKPQFIREGVAAHTS